jgi:anti-anti-sigma factor
MTDDPDATDVPPPLCRVEVHVDGTNATVAIFGEIDLFTVGRVEDQLRQLHETHDLTGLVVDMGAVTFMDSTGLRLLVSLMRHAGEGGYRLRLVRPAPTVHRVIEIAGLDSLLAFVDDPVDAQR